MDTNKFCQSKLFKRILVGVGLLVIILVSFGAGVSVGYNKVRFSYAWGENYDRNFGGPPRGIFGFPANQFPPNPGFINPHGTFGTVLYVTSSGLAINGEDKIEKTILFSSSTIIRGGRSDMQATDLEVGDPVVVIGSPDGQGQIKASFIRTLR